MNTEETVESEDNRGLSKEQPIQSNTETSQILATGSIGLGKGALRIFQLGFKKIFEGDDTAFTTENKGIDKRKSKKKKPKTTQKGSYCRKLLHKLKITQWLMLLPRCNMITCQALITK